LLQIYAGTTNGPRNVSLHTGVPSYQWSYVEVLSKKAFEQVVVVGINIPNLNKKTVKPYIFCRDICNTIPWLRSFGAQRTQASSGYIFCCSSAEARRLISEFPKIAISQIVITARHIITRKATRRTTTISRTAIKFKTTTKYGSEGHHSGRHYVELESGEHYHPRTTTKTWKTTTKCRTTKKHGFKGHYFISHSVEHEPRLIITARSVITRKATRRPTTINWNTVEFKS
jgi:hypothetical protein